MDAFLIKKNYSFCCGHHLSWLKTAKQGAAAGCNGPDSASESLRAETVNPMNIM